MTRIQFPSTFLGFDDIFRELNRPMRDTTFPPYNIVSTGDHHSQVELAVAGFGRHEIKITQEEDRLVIEGEKELDEDVAYLHKGIAGRSFRKVFRLHTDIKVVGADLTNGLLTVYLERIVPEEKQPKTIEIK